MRKTITTAVLVLAAAALAGTAHADGGDDGGNGGNGGNGGDLTVVGGKAASYLCALTSATGTTTGARYLSCSGNMPVHL
ncbi:hypothetical protein GTW59_11715 [Streptomyces sp. SID89]|nr:hypothetical protein [Streptomyces sp. SID89]